MEEKVDFKESVSISKVPTAHKASQQHKQRAERGTCRGTREGGIHVHITLWLLSVPKDTDVENNSI